MILYYSSNICIFQGEGFEKENLLLLRMFNNYSIRKFLKILKTLKDSLSLNLNIYLKKNIINIISNFILIKDIQWSKEKKLRGFIIKKLIGFHLLKVYKLLINEKKIWFNILNELEITNNKNTHHISSKKNAFFLEKIPKYLDLGLLMTYKLSKKLNLALKKEIYNKEYSFISKFKRNINNVNNKSILVVGEASGLYTGSYTPFISTKFNWFVSTGLKSDIECNHLDPFNQVDPIEKRNSKSEELIPLENIIFKINNFKEKVTKKLKKTERNSYYYQIMNTNGIRGFMSEAQTTFNLKANYLYFFNQNLLLETLNINNIYYRLHNNNNLENYKNILKISKIKFLKYFYITQNTKREKFFFILFKLSHSCLDYYSLLVDGLYENFKECFDFYRSLVYFMHMSKSYLIIVRLLLRKIINNLLKKNYKLKVENSYFLYSYDFLNSILHIFFINLNFINKMKKYIAKYSFFNFFFNIFLIKKKINLLKHQEKKSEDGLDKIFFSYRLLKKYTWFNFSKFTWYYLNFLLEWRINLGLFIGITNFKKHLGLKCINSFILLRDEFKELKEEWADEGSRNIKEFVFFFLEFVTRFAINLKKILYFSFYKNLDLTKRFTLLNLYFYFEKLLNKDFIVENIGLSSTITLSSLFLGKWFYYRHLHKLFDNNLDYNYGHIRKLPRFLNTSLLESNYYNLKFVNKTRMVKLDYRLDSYFLRLKYKNLGKIKLDLETKLIKKKISSSIKGDKFLGLKKKIKNYIESSFFLFKKNLWFKRYTHAYSNLLKTGEYAAAHSKVFIPRKQTKTFAQGWRKWKSVKLSCLIEQGL